MGVGQTPPYQQLMGSFSFSGEVSKDLLPKSHLTMQLLLTICLLGVGVVIGESDTKSQPENTTGSIDDIILINQGISEDKLRGKVLVEGDILLNPTTYSSKTNQLWPKTGDVVIIAYVLDPDYLPEHVALIMMALKEFERKTCIRFVARTAERDYVYIKPGSGCYSILGYKGKKQEVSLSFECLEKGVGVVLHELMHVLCFWHEHSRSDRNDFVWINFTAITPGYEINFCMYDTTNRLAGRYDLGSILHYSRYAFSKEGHQTIVPHEGVEIGQRVKLSEEDVRKVNRLYECPQYRPRKGETEINYSKFVPVIYKCDLEEMQSDSTVISSSPYIGNTTTSFASVSSSVNSEPLVNKSTSPSTTHDRGTLNNVSKVEELEPKVAPNHDEYIKATSLSTLHEPTFKVTTGPSTTHELKPKALNDVSNIEELDPKVASDHNENIEATSLSATHEPPFKWTTSSSTIHGLNNVSNVEGLVPKVATDHNEHIEATSLSATHEPPFKGTTDPSAIHGLNNVSNVEGLVPKVATDHNEHIEATSLSATHEPPFKVTTSPSTTHELKPKALNNASNVEDLVHKVASDHYEYIEATSLLATHEPPFKGTTSHSTIHEHEASMTPSIIEEHGTATSSLSSLEQEQKMDNNFVDKPKNNAPSNHFTTCEPELIATTSSSVIHQSLHATDTSQPNPSIDLKPEQIGTTSPPVIYQSWHATNPSPPNPLSDPELAHKVALSHTTEQNVATSPSTIPTLESKVATSLYTTPRPFRNVAVGILAIYRLVHKVVSSHSSAQSSNTTVNSFSTLKPEYGATINSTSTREPEQKSPNPSSIPEFMHQMSTNTSSIQTFNNTASNHSANHEDEHNLTISSSDIQESPGNKVVGSFIGGQSNRSTVDNSFTGDKSHHSNVTGSINGEESNNSTVTSSITVDQSNNHTVNSSTIVDESNNRTVDHSVNVGQSNNRTVTSSITVDQSNNHTVVSSITVDQSNNSTVDHSKVGQSNSMNVARSITVDQSTNNTVTSSITVDQSNNHTVDHSITVDQSNHHTVVSSITVDQSINRTVDHSATLGQYNSSNVARSITVDQSNSSYVNSSITADQSNNHIVTSSITADQSNNRTVTSSITADQSNNRTVISSITVDQSNHHTVVSSITVDQSNNSTVDHSFNVGQSNSRTIISSITVGQSNNHTVDGLTVGYSNSSTVTSSITVDQSNNRTVDHSLTVGHSNSSNVTSSITVRQSNTSTVDNSVGQSHISTVTSSITVDQSNNSTANHSLTSGHSNSSNVTSSITVGQSNTHSTVDNSVGQSHISTVTSSITVGQSNISTITSSITVDQSHSSTVDSSLHKMSTTIHDLLNNSNTNHGKTPSTSQEPQSNSITIPYAENKPTTSSDHAITGSFTIYTPEHTSSPSSKLANETNISIIGVPLYNAMASTSGLVDLNPDASPNHTATSDQSKAQLLKNVVKRALSDLKETSLTEKEMQQQEKRDLKRKFRKPYFSKWTTKYNSPCGFERGMCGWKQSADDDLDWTWSWGSVDLYSGHFNAKGFHLSLRGRPHGPVTGKKARLTRLLTQPFNCITFWYGSLHSTMGDLHIYTISHNGEKTFLWSAERLKDVQWTKAQIDLPQLALDNDIQVVVEGDVGAAGSKIFIDNLYVGNCI